MEFSYLSFQKVMKIENDDWGKLKNNKNRVH